MQWLHKPKSNKEFEKLLYLQAYANHTKIFDIDHSESKQLSSDMFNLLTLVSSRRFQHCKRQCRRCVPIMYTCPAHHTSVKHLQTTYWRPGKRMGQPQQRYLVMLSRLPAAAISSSSSSEESPTCSGPAPWGPPVPLRSSSLMTSEP